MNLIEGVDIDADFAKLLREDKNTTNSGGSWSGYGKAQDQLTDDDLADLSTIRVERRSLTSLKGIEYATNLKTLYCSKNQISSFDISSNSELTTLDCSSNPLSNLDVTQNLKLETLNFASSQLNSIDVTQNLKLTNLNCRANQLSSLDVTQNSELVSLDCMSNQLTSLDVTQNSKLISLLCDANQLIGLDVSQNLDLSNLTCINNSINAIDLTYNVKLSSLNVGWNPITDIDLSQNINLLTLNCESTSISQLDLSSNAKLKNVNCCQCSLLVDVILAGANDLDRLDANLNPLLVTLDTSQNPKLRSLYCYDSGIANLDLSQNTMLLSIECQRTQLTNLDLTQNSKLVTLKANDSKLVSLLVSGADELNQIYCENNQLTTLDVSQNKKLYSLYCQNNNLKSLVLNGAEELYFVNCWNNQVTELDVNQLSKLNTLNCGSNELTSLTVAGAEALATLQCDSNKLATIDVSQNLALQSLDCNENNISDITSAYGLTQLSILKAEGQQLLLPVPIVVSGQANVDILKTTNQLGLTATNGTIIGSPILTPNGDIIELSNVTRESLEGRYLSFNYNGSQLTEGAASGSKEFAGNIQFYSVSDLASSLEPKDKKVYSGEEVEWTWIITNVGGVKSEEIRAILDLPVGLTIDASSIEVDGTTGSISDLDGTNSLGDLASGQMIKITFKTTVTGNPEEWFEAKGELKWRDATPSSPYAIQIKGGAVQVLDEEQTYTPKDSKNIAITSVPVYFNHGIRSVQNTAQTYGLDAVDYQTNTNVVTDGFYTRIKDDRATSVGWKLTAKLSDFKDSSNTLMPNGTGTSLKLENLSIERVTDRDTPQETIDPSPTGVDVPSSVQSTETIVAGQPTAKTLVTAQPNEGQDTWQLRMPFDKISLNLPANAGKKGIVYKAKLTWSLDDTP